MNNIAITWSSDQKQLIADMQRRQVLQDKEIARLQQLAGVGKASGTAITNSYRDANKELDRLGRIAETAFKKPVSAMDAHLARMKELRVLYRMGKIDAEQFNQAANASLKQRYADTGFTDRLKQQKRDAADLAAFQERQLAAERAAAAKSLQEQKAAALSLALQKATAIHEAEQSERSAAEKLHAEQQAAAQALRLQKLTAIHEAEQAERTAAAKLLQEQKDAAQSLRLQKLTALDDEKRSQDEAAAALRLQKFTAIDEEQRLQKQASDSLRLQKFTEIDEEQRAQREATQSLRLQKLTAIHEEMEQQKRSAAEVRRGLMSQRDLARQSYLERLRQIHELHAAGLLSQKELNAAAQQALVTFEKTSRVNMGGIWQAVPGQIQAALTATSAMYATMRLARMEMENLRSMQRDSANTTMTYAEAQSEAVQNLDSSMTAAELDDAVMALAKEKHLSPAFVMRAASNVLGARGGVSAKEAIGAIRTSIDFNPYDQGTANFTASAMLQAKAANPEASFEQILGQQKSAKIASPVVKDEDFAHYLVPGASGAKAFGDSERDFYGLAAHLGSRMGDSAGRVTGTATIDLQRDLATNPGVADVKVGPEGATISRLRAIAFDKKYASVKQKLLGEVQAQTQDELVRSGGKLTTEARAYGAIALLLQGDEESWKQLEEKRAEVLELGKEAEALVEKHREALSNLPAQRTARAEIGIKAENEIVQLENQGAARGSVSREGLKDILKSSGLSATDQYIQGLRFEINSVGGQTAPASAAAAMLRERAAGLAGGERIDGSQGILEYLLFRLTGQDSGVKKRVANEEENRTAEALIRAADALEKLAQDERGVQVIMPGAGEKPAPPAAAGLGAP